MKHNRRTSIILNYKLKGFKNDEMKQSIHTHFTSIDHIEHLIESGREKPMFMEKHRQFIRECFYGEIFNQTLLDELKKNPHLLI